MRISELEFGPAMICCGYKWRDVLPEYWSGPRVVWDCQLDEYSNSYTNQLNLVAQKKPRIFPCVEDRTKLYPMGHSFDFPVGWGLSRLCRLTVQVLFNRPFVRLFGDFKLDWHSSRQRNEIDLLGSLFPRLHSMTS